MTIGAIPFGIPNELAFDYAAGAIQRYGSILKSAETGRIVGHLQETGMLQSLLSNATAVPLGPVSAAAQVGGAVANLVQNQQIKKKIDVMQEMMGSLQTVQIASLVTSVAGIGVTVASTAIMLNRMAAIRRDVQDIATRIDGLPAKLREIDLEKTITDVETQLDRLTEAPHRRDAVQVVTAAESVLHEKFGHLTEGTRKLVIAAKVDEALLHALLTAISLCGTAQTRALFWLDHKTTARDRAVRQTDHLRRLAFDMPRDEMAKRLSSGNEGAARIAALASETRLRMASIPSLGQRLVELGVNGREYIERAADEKDQPVLILPAAA